MSNVITLPVITTLDISADRVRDSIPDDMDTLIVVGFDADGDFYFASNKSDGADALWLFELAKKKLLEMSSL